MKLQCTNPKHTDNTPSMHVYEDGSYCFTCGWVDRSRVTLEEKKEPENIKEKIEYIANLSSKSIRGLNLKSDSEGYYILWPEGDFYKLRPFDGTGLRYKGPSGHRAPLFNLGPMSETLVVVEGEINALSLAEAFPTRKFAISSSGSCNELLRHLPIYLTYDQIVIIVDKDPGGVACGVELKQILLKKGKRVQLIATTPDYNEILQEKGKIGVFNKFKEDLGL